ncbi:MFS transporter [Leucobacter denitrificans]|uniref:MFS transporter n=1 Tax=Leucobacter denitrificans TaxID=683042 RepID=A0A7G9S3I0_9MICO|nr:MFS transporter [Leucobacter denitrificans]QNN62405.1 MFS transporter [Leucobacter denitrificans]
MNATPDFTSDVPDRRFQQGGRAYKRTLIALFCAGLANFALMYAPQPLLPELATRFQVSADASSWVIGATTIGVALGVLPLARLSDRVGRVRLMRWAPTSRAPRSVGSRGALWRRWSPTGGA